MALSGKKKIKYDEICKKISELSSQKFKLNREYAETIAAYKKADERGFADLSGWVIFLIGIPIYLVLFAICLYLRINIAFSNDLLESLSTFIFFALILAGIPALVYALVRYVFEDMLSDILKIPHRKKYKKYKEELIRIETQLYILSRKRSALLASNKPKPTSTKSKGSSGYSPIVYPEPEPKPEYRVELEPVIDISDM